jgi:uncharacterized membrane protein YhaH (DUF805 family)
MATPEKTYWLDRSENVTRLYHGLWVLGLLLFAADLLVHRHEDFGWAEWLGFYAVYGFLACVALVVAAKEILRRTVMRSEDYYDR